MYAKYIWLTAECYEYYTRDKYGCSMDVRGVVGNFNIEKSAQIKVRSKFRNSR